MEKKDDVNISYEYIYKIKELNNEYSMKTGKQRTYDIRIFGCQMNEHDAEKLSGMLEEMGYTKAFEATADLVIFETCCVRENAEEKVYGHLGELKKHRKNMILAMAGCMAQQPKVVEKIRNSYHHVKIVFGTHNLHMFPLYLYKHITTGKRIFDIWEDHESIAEDIPINRADRVKAWVNIMYGCNNFCSYCIVPYTRGRERSRRMEDIVSEVELLAQKGYREITLLGQNVNSYGNDWGDKDSFAALLFRLNEIAGISRIRFMTPHPKDLSDVLIDAIRDCSKVCEHLHLPFQSGSSKILNKMNRHYTKEQYLALVNKVRKKNPGIALSTDIIVGFPGETEEDFSDTLDIVEKIGFEMAYIFIYSKRSGTPAAVMEEQVPEEIKKERFQRLTELQTSIADRLSSMYEDESFEVLVEGESKQNPYWMTGRTRSNKIVNFKANKDFTGQLKEVFIKRAGAFWLEGERVVDS